MPVGRVVLERGLAMDPDRFSSSRDRIARFRCERFGIIVGDIFTSVLVFSMAAALMTISNSAFGQEAFNVERFSNLGAPVRRNALYNHVLGKDANGNERYYHAYRGDPWFLLSIDPRTGDYEEYIAGRKGNPYGMLWAGNNRLYVATGGGGTDDVFVFDPTTKALAYLGRPTETETVVWSLCEAGDGKLYGGTYPNAKLVSIDLKTHKLADLGRISPDQKYVRFLDTKGRYVYCNAGPSKAAVWAYNIETGDKTQILPERLRKVLSWGTAQKRADGHVYIRARKEVFRVNGLELEPVERLAAGRVENYQGSPARFPLTMQDGTRIRADHHSGPRKRFFIRRPEQMEATVKIDYTGSPTTLWAVQEGPDGLIYGTTRSPITLFAFDPQTSSTRVLGDPIGRHGQVYGWVWHDGKLFMAAYGKSRLTVWDPGRPWNFGTTPDSNPRLLGGCHISRPASLIVAPDGKYLLAGGVPGYGRVGGVLTVIEPEVPVIETIKGLFGEQSVASMVAIPDTDLVCIGTTWRGGSASEAKPSDLRLILWDFRSRKIVYETAPVPGESSIVQMVLVDRRVYCTTRDEGHLVVFDPYGRRVLHTAPLGLGGGSLFGLRYREADRMLYAISGESIVRIHPEGFAIQRLGTYPGLGYGMALSGDFLYLCSGTSLIRFAIPPVASGER